MALKFTEQIVIQQACAALRTELNTIEWATNNPKARERIRQLQTEINSLEAAAVRGERK